MDKRFWIIIAVIAVIFGGIVWFSDKDKKDEGPGGDTSKASSHILGTPGAKVKLVEYGDFECAYCGAYFPVVEQVVEKYKDKIEFQFHHLPITQIHKNAFVASRAAEAASLQGKFWEMYRLIYANQSAWVTQSNAQPTFEGYARQLGLDITKFNTDYASRAVNDTINGDVAKFNKTGMKKATPTFTLNGKQIKPDNNVESFSKLIDAELKKQGK